MDLRTKLTDRVVQLGLALHGLPVQGSDNVPAWPAPADRPASPAPESSRAFVARCIGRSRRDLLRWLGGGGRA